MPLARHAAPADTVRALDEAFIGAVAGSGLVREVLCRRGPEGGWWVETDQPTRDLVHLIWTTGGRPYARAAGTQTEPQSAGSGAWRQLDLDGVPTGPTLDADGWPQVEHHPRRPAPARHPALEPRLVRRRGARPGAAAGAAGPVRFLKAFLVPTPQDR